MIEVKQSGRARNHCFDRPPFRTFLEVQDGWNEDGTRRMKVIQFRGDMGCPYSASTIDTGCTGCKWNQREKQACGKS